MHMYSLHFRARVGSTGRGCDGNEDCFPSDAGLSKIKVTRTLALPLWWAYGTRS